MKKRPSVSTSENLPTHGVSVRPFSLSSVLRSYINICTIIAKADLILCEITTVYVRTYVCMFVFA